MNHRNRITTVIIPTLLMAACFAIFVPKSLLAGEKMVFSTVLPENSCRAKWYTLVYSEAFRRLGWELEFRQYPLKRGAYLANKGEVDGEPGRVADFNTMYPNLIRVNEPLWTVRISAYTIDKKIRLHNWGSLRNRGFRVNYTRGIKKCEEMLPQVVKAGMLEAVNGDSQGLRKLLKDRTDIYVGLESVIIPLLKNEAFAGFPINKAGLLGEFGVYGFLHKKHKQIVPKLETVLRAMKEEGLLEQYGVQAASQHPWKPDGHACPPRVR